MTDTAAAELGIPIENATPIVETHEHYEPLRRTCSRSVEREAHTTSLAEARHLAAHPAVAVPRTQLSLSGLSEDSGAPRPARRDQHAGSARP